jgi:hypothetical protein
MKKILLTSIVFLTLISFNKVFSQTFTTTTGKDSVSAFSNGDSNIDVHNDINALIDSVKINWKLEGYYFAPSLTFTGFCDNSDCRGAVQLLAGTTFTSDSYYKNKPGIFKAQFADSGAVSGAISYVTILVIGGTTTKRLTFILNKTGVGVVTTVKEENVNPYPNPARDFVNITYDPKDNIKTAVLYNLIGKAIQAYKVSNNASAKLDFDNNLAAGVYFVRLMNDRGQVVATRRFTKQ